METYYSTCEQDTRALAEKLARAATPGTVVCLEGELGVGKTVFAKGFCEALGVSQPISSPTFTIVNEYQGIMPVYHFDLYRIADVSELEEIGFDEYVYGAGVCLIEWPDNAGDALPAGCVRVTLTRDFARGDDARRITVDKKA